MAPLLTRFLTPLAACAILATMPGMALAAPLARAQPERPDSTTTTTRPNTDTLVRGEAEYQHEGTTYRGYLVYNGANPDTGPRPAIIVFHEWWGLNDYARTRADMLAKLGYVAFAPDLYAQPPTDDPAIAGQRARALYADRALFRARLNAAMDALTAMTKLVDTDNIAAIGYCMGGTAALELARSGAPLKAIVSFHGGLGTPNEQDNANIKAKVLVCNGSADPLVPFEERQAFIESMNRHNIDFKFIEYAGAVHSFTNPAAGKGARAGNPASQHHPIADERSWSDMRLWLADTIGQPLPADPSLP
ncbi:MAG: dienelactone hydrolase family protein [Phycisphaerales bacterium]